MSIESNPRRGEPRAASKHRNRIFLLVIAAVSLIFLFARTTTRSAASAAVLQQPNPTPTLDRLATPIMPESPTQLDIGRHSYYHNCMPCHGDQGQGLTDEWRAVWVEDHQNCWEHGCHGGHRDDEGFPIPRDVPALTGSPQALARFATADDLFDYLRRTQPPQRPGDLSDDDYWALTAFLLHENGRLPGGAEVGPGAEDSAGPHKEWIGVVAAGFAIALTLVFWAKKRGRSVLALLLVSVALIGCSTVDPAPAPATPTATLLPTASIEPDLVLTLTADRLAKPAMPAHPTQADKGAEVYWFICLPCHGDRGQGLTEEWRQVFGVEEQNCWQSDCHGSRHPPEGFELPRSVPPVIGADALTRLSTAEDLYHIISTSMPWWDPDYVGDEDAWNLSAYLLRARNGLPVRATLGRGNASVFRLHDASAPADDERSAVVALIALIALAAVALAARGSRRQGRFRSDLRHPSTTARKSARLP
jgi:mono/diheme cytochrome c family protein